MNRILLVAYLTLTSDNVMLENQGVVTPLRTVVTAKTGVKKWSTGQGVFLPLDNFNIAVKRSRAFLQCGQAVKNDSPNFLIPVLVVTTVHMGVPTLCKSI